jgi:stromal membrane-associated protein
MSRRPPNPAAERAARNSKVIKDLLKLDHNKLCADCKRNKHPRWASWNLGVFVCIRCSGIHRGMGTHISRVKSVDLDSWTDEQLASIVSWGNARAKKYWEAKLAPEHVPSEAKIENFIRTKYELKRWTMDGPIPDPSTLDDDVDEDDDVPLAVVKEKVALERGAPAASAQQGGGGGGIRPIAAPPAPAADLLGGSVSDPVPARASSGPPAQRVPPKADAAPPKTTTTSKDSLLGLDFFQPAAPPRPASTTGGASAAAGQSRPDLKQSILSLYASAPKPQHNQQQQQPTSPNSGMFGGVPSPTRAASSGLGDLNNAFGGLSFSTQPAQPPKPVDPFAGLGSASLHSPKQSQSSNSGSTFGGLSGGSFFDTSSRPAQTQASAPRHGQTASSGSNSFGDFASFASPAPASKPAVAAPPSSSAFGDLVGLSAPVSQSSAAAPKPAAASPSVFNLSSTTATASAAPTTSTSAWASSDVWDSNAWSTADKSPNLAAAAPKTTTTTNDFGWGTAASAAPSMSAGFGMGSLAAQSIVPGVSGFAAAPKVAADEEFGGWASGTTTTTGAGKAAGSFGGNDDLFSNVWQ